MRFRRRKTEKPESHGDGVLVRDAAAEHRCQPPGCYEWPAGEWKINKPKRYPEGTVWRCECGSYWKSSRYDPNSLGRGNGLWLNWYELYGSALERVLADEGGIASE